MTSKEKAQEIVDSMMRTGDPHHTECICFEIAKRCALIAVDEIIYVLDQYIDPVRKYWEEVKLEIQKL